MVKGDWTVNEFLLPASICFLKTKDGHLKGAIGELIAWKYLRRHCMVWSLAATWPASALLPDVVLSKCLKARQLRYLKHVQYAGRYRWDFLAIRTLDYLAVHSGKLLPRNVENRYIVEVKSGVMKDKYGFRVRLPRTSDYSKIIADAKSFGFTPILMTVGFGDDWTFHVSCRELR
jgi:hypothetical protein